jgi:hypothetical protein
MRGMALLAAFAGVMSAQEPSRAPFQPWPSGPDTLHCEVAPSHPSLNFALRMQAGFTVRIPMSQYRGPGHNWRIWLRVKPPGDDKQPVYFLNRFRLPPVPETKAWGEVGGAVQLGEGRYAASVLVRDDMGRTCTHDWPIDIQYQRAARGLETAMPAGVVTSLWTHASTARREPAFDRLTVLLHAAPAASRAMQLRPGDLELWLSEVTSLLEQAPARHVRFVVFNLEQQRELFRDEDFQLDRLNLAAEAIYNLQLLTVDYHVLQRRTGDVDFLADLVNQEMTIPERSEAVVFVGPYRFSPNKVQRWALTRPEWETKSDAQRYFYLRYRPMPRIFFPGVGPLEDMEMGFQRGGGGGGGGGRGGQPMPDPFGMANQDAIGSLVSMLKGKTLDVYSPHDFANAVRKVAKK